MATQELSVRPKQEVSEEQTRAGRTFVPDVDIYETKDGLWLEADMPGVDESSVQVKFDNGVLTIEGTVDVDEYKNINPTYSEYRVGNYRRSFALSNEIDAERIHGKLTNGVLQLELPKAEKAKPRQITISAS